MLIQQIVNGLSLGAIYAVFAIGFTLIFGVMNLLNLSQGAVFMWGAYVGLEVVCTLQLPLLAAIPAAIVAAGLLGVLSELIVFRPLARRGAHRWMGMVGSLALTRILIGLAQEAFGTEVVRYPDNSLAGLGFDLFGARIELLQIVAIGASLAMMLALAALLHLTNLGRAIRTTAFSETVARLVGVPVNQIRLVTFFVSGALAGGGRALVAAVPIRLALHGREHPAQGPHRADPRRPRQCHRGSGRRAAAGAGGGREHCRHRFRLSRRGRLWPRATDPGDAPDWPVFDQGDEAGMTWFYYAYENVIDLCLLNALLACGCALLLRINLLSLATGGLMAIGAYLAIWLTMRHGWWFGPALLAAVAAAALAAAGLGVLVLRLRGDYFAMGTLAFTEVVRIVAFNWDSVTGGALGVFGIPKLTQTWHLALLLAAVIYLIWAVRRSPLGERMQAVAADELAVTAAGHDVARFKLAIFTASGAIAGLGGALAAHLNMFVSPNDFGFACSVDAVIAPVLGGFGSLFGPAIGATALTVLPEVLRFSILMREVLIGAVMLLAVLFLPTGLTSLPALLLRRRRAAA